MQSTGAPRGMGLGRVRPPSLGNFTCKSVHLGVFMGKNILLPQYCLLG